MVIVSDRITKVVQIWRWTLLLHCRSVETIVGSGESMTSVATDGACKRFSHLRHRCVVEQILSRSSDRLENCTALRVEQLQVA